MSSSEAERLIALYLDRKRSGQYFAPLLDPIALHELSLQLTMRTPSVGSRALDIMHVAAARLCDATLFVTADKRQADLAEVAGSRTVKLVASAG